MNKFPSGAHLPLRGEEGKGAHQSDCWWKLVNLNSYCSYFRDPMDTCTLFFQTVSLVPTHTFSLKGHVTRGNFSCNLSHNVCCETSCRKDFTCNTPVLQPATATKCCVASCKKIRNILNFLQRCETSCFV